MLLYLAWLTYMVGVLTVTKYVTTCAYCPIVLQCFPQKKNKGGRMECSVLCTMCIVVCGTIVAMSWL